MKMGMAKQKEMMVKSIMLLSSALPVLGALYSPLTKSREGKEILR